MEVATPGDNWFSSDVMKSTGIELDRVHGAVSADPPYLGVSYYNGSEDEGAYH